MCKGRGSRQPRVNINHVTCESRISREKTNVIHTAATSLIAAQWEVAGSGVSCLSLNEFVVRLLVIRQLVDTLAPTGSFHTNKQQSETPQPPTPNTTPSRKIHGPLQCLSDNRHCPLQYLSDKMHSHLGCLSVNRHGHLQCLSDNRHSHLGCLSSKS